MKFYLYPLETISHTIKWDYDRFFANRWIKEAYQALAGHPARILDPNNADSFIVSTTLICLSFVGFNKTEINRYIKQLPHWRTGKPHLVFDLTDQPDSFYDRSIQNQLVILKSAFHQQYYRQGIDISIPQFPRYRFNDVDECKHLSIISTNKRKYTIGFKGHPRKGLNPVRDTLFKFHNGIDWIVLPSSGFEFKIKKGGSDVEFNLSQDLLSYTQILFNSKFALLPRGNGYALSYRMIEAMNTGSIPIIISDGYVLPFSEFIDYTKFSFRIPETKVKQLPKIIETLVEEDLDKMQIKVLEIYHQYFNSTHDIIYTSIKIWQNSINVT